MKQRYLFGNIQEYSATRIQCLKSKQSALNICNFHFDFGRLFEEPKFHVRQVLFKMSNVQNRTEFRFLKKIVYLTVRYFVSDETQLKIAKMAAVFIVSYLVKYLISRDF